MSIIALVLYHTIPTIISVMVVHQIVIYNWYAHRGGSEILVGQLADISVGHYSVIISCFLSSLCAISGP